MKEFNHQVELTTGVLGEECSHLTSSFFLELRKRKKDKDIKSVAKNIRIVDYCNMEKIIPKVDVVITHGGYGTIKECIYYKKNVEKLCYAIEQKMNLNIL